MGKDYMSLFFLLNPLILYEIVLQNIANYIHRNNKDSYSKNEYSLPFDDLWYVANGGEEIETSHSWDIISQRYAYDFVIVKNETTNKNIKAKNNKDFYCFGKPIYSAKEGKVVKTVNWIPDGRPSQKENPFIPSIIGNFVIIEHDNKEYSVYAHLKQNSVVVRKGQLVQKGELIGQCGSSGNSSEPHLHFQVQKGKSFHLSAPLIIRFENIEVIISDEHYTFDEITIQKDTYVKNKD